MIFTWKNWMFLVRIKCYIYNYLQAITLAIVDQYLCHHTPSLGRNELIILSIILMINWSTIMPCDQLVNHPGKSGQLPGHHSIWFLLPHL